MSCHPKKIQTGDRYRPYEFCKHLISRFPAKKEWDMAVGKLS